MMDRWIDLLHAVGPALTRSFALFVLQGLVIGAVALGFSRVLIRSSARARYVTHMLTLVLMLACLPINMAIFWEAPLAQPRLSERAASDQDPASEVIEPEPASPPDAFLTPEPAERVPLSDLTVEQWSRLDESTRDQPGVVPRMWSSRHSSEFDPSMTVLVPPASGLDADAPAEQAAPAIEKGSAGSTDSAWERWTPWVLGAYLSGLCVFLLRLLAALHGGRRLIRSAHRVDRGHGLWAVVLEQAHRLGLAQSRVPGVGLLSGHRATGGPILVGLIKPMLLLPAAVVTQLTPAQLEAVIAHELAHLRRYDHWFILLQRIIETLLFFHPMVWVISRQVSHERENACDDLVLSGGTDPTDYATALIEVLTLSGGGARVPATAAALTRDALHRRILRLFGEQANSPLRLARAGLEVCVATVAVLGIVVFVIACQAQRDSADNDPGALTEQAGGSVDDPGLSIVKVVGYAVPQRAWYWSELEPVSGKALRRAEDAEDYNELLAEHPLLGGKEAQVLALTERDWHAMSAADLVGLFDHRRSDANPDEPIRLSDAATSPGLPLDWRLVTRILGYKTTDGDYGMIRLRVMDGQPSGTRDRVLCHIRRAVEQPVRYLMEPGEAAEPTAIAHDRSLEQLHSISGVFYLADEVEFSAVAGATYVLNLKTQGSVPKIALYDPAGQKIAQMFGRSIDPHACSMIWTADKTQNISVRVSCQIETFNGVPPQQRVYSLDIASTGKTLDASPMPADAEHRGAVELVGSSYVTGTGHPRLGLYYFPDRQTADLGVLDLLIAAGFDPNLLYWYRVDLIRSDAEGQPRRYEDVRLLTDAQLPRGAKPVRTLHTLKPGDRVVLLPRDLVTGPDAVALDRPGQGWGAVIDGLNGRWQEPTLRVPADSETVVVTFEVRNLSTLARLWRTDGELADSDLMSGVLFDRQYLNIRQLELSYDYRLGARQASVDEVAHGPNPYAPGSGILPPGGRIEYMKDTHLLPPGSSVIVTVKVPRQRLTDLLVVRDQLYLSLNPDRYWSIGILTSREMPVMELGPLELTFEPEAPGEPAPAWGEPVDGVRAKIMRVHTDANGQPLEAVTLRAVVDAPGNDRLFLANHPAWRCYLHVDGAYYRKTDTIEWAGPVMARNKAYLSDSDFQFLFTLEGEDGHGSEWLAVKDGKPLTLSPGPHRLRFHWRVMQLGEQDLSQVPQNDAVYLKTGLLDITVGKDGDADAWGEPVDGVRAAIEQVETDPDGKPIDGVVLRAIVQDPGSDLLFLANHPAWGCKLEVDGQWYRPTAGFNWEGPIAARSTFYTRDSDFTLQMPIDHKDPFGSEWVSVDDGKPLVLAPGRHQVVFHWRVMNLNDKDLSLVPEDQAVYLKTGLLDITVGKDGDADAWGEPVDGVRAAIEQVQADAEGRQSDGVMLRAFTEKPGSKRLTLANHPLWGCYLEVDGERYKPYATLWLVTGPNGVFSSGYTADGEYKFFMPIEEQDKHGSSWVSADDGTPLVLAPGQHTIRFAWRIMQRNGQDLSQVPEDQVAYLKTGLLSVTVDAEPAAPAEGVGALTEPPQPEVAYAQVLENLYNGVDRAELARQLRLVPGMEQALARSGGGRLELRPMTRDLIKLAEQLEAMAKEDAAWREPADVEALSVGDQIDYHVYHLRDVAGKSFSVPGKVNVLHQFSTKPETRAPAVALRNLGKPAIPALIALLHDDRPIRSISTAMNGMHILRYRDAGVQVLSAIAGQEFMPYVNRGVYFSNATQEIQDEVVSEIKQWWQDNQDKTEAQWLRKALTEDGVGSNVAGDDRAERLVALEGLASLDLFRQRLIIEPENGNAVRHFWLAATSEGPAEAAVLDEVRAIAKGPHPDPRAQAYRILLKHGTAEDTQRIIPRLVEEVDAIAKLEDWSWRGVGFNFDPEDMITLLCRDAQPAGFHQAVKLLSHEDPRIAGNAINDLLSSYNAEAGPALDEPSFDLLVEALVDAIDERPNGQGEPLHVSYRLRAAQWLFRKFDMHHEDRHHRRIATPLSWPNLKEEEKLPFVRDVVAWCKERAEIEQRGELPEDARPHDNGVTITGRVLDQPGGEGAQGVTVTLLATSDHSRRHAMTDADGRYAFPAVPAIGMSHQLQVGIHTPGIYTYSTYLHVPVPEERLGLQEIKAERDLYAEHPYTLQGVVTDAQTGAGIPRAQLQVKMGDGNPGSLVTDEHGRYRIHTVTPEVTVECDGDHQRYYGPPAKPDEGEDLGKANVRSRTVKLERGKTVDGVDFKLYPAPAYALRFVMPDGSPASDVEIYVLKMYTPLDPILEEGRFGGGFGSMGNTDRLTTNADGRMNGYLRSIYGREQRAQIELSVIARTSDLKYGVTKKINLTTDDPPPDGLEIKLEPCATAELQVVDPDGQAVQFATMWIRPEFKGHVFGYPESLPKTTAIGEGRFRFEGMIAGWTYRLDPSAEGYKTLKPLYLPIEAGEHKNAGELRMDWWGPRAVPGLINQLQHQDAEEREKACRDLASLGSDAGAAVPALIERLKNDPNNTVRYTAANALGKIGDAAILAVPQLIHALEHDESGVPREAAIALGQLAGREAIPALTKALNHDDLDTRRVVIEALVRIADSDAIDPLSAVIRDPEMHHRTKIHAVQSLEKIGSPLALPVLRDVSKSEIWTLKEAAEKAIRAIEFLNQPQVSVAACLGRCPTFAVT